MSRTELQQRSLDLPEAERAELAAELAGSLEAPETIRALRDRLANLEVAKMDALRKKLEATMESWFEGESTELTPERWAELLSHARSEDRLDEPFGQGVPAEWTGRTPRELRMSLKPE